MDDAGEEVVMERTIDLLNRAPYSRFELYCRSYYWTHTVPCVVVVVVTAKVHTATTTPIDGGVYTRRFGDDSFSKLLHLLHMFLISKRPK